MEEFKNLKINSISLGDHVELINENEINDFKGKLIKLLNEYTKTLITDKSVSIDEKKLIESKANIIELLTEMSSKQDNVSNNLIINLDDKFRHEIIDLLIKNENIIIDFENKIDTSSKKKLIRQNNDLISKLINLSVENLNYDSETDENDENGENDDNKEKSDEIESKDNEFDIIVSNKLETEFTNFKNEIISLKKKVKILEKRLKDESSQMDNLKKELDEKVPLKLRLEIKDFKNFISKKNNSLFSEPIIFHGIEWSIEIVYDYWYDLGIFKRNFLGFYLRANNKVDDENKVKWECETSFDLILVNNYGNDRIENLDHTFKESSGFGMPEFISFDDLFKNHSDSETFIQDYLFPQNILYIKDNSIKFRVNLRIDRILRNI